MPEKSRRLKPTPEVLARMRKAISEEERPEVIAANRARGRQLHSSREEAVSAAICILQQLAEQKEAQHLSLSDLQERTGIGRSNLSRLWNNPAPNVTLETVERIAAALNCRLQITLKREN
jgi:DNA-binding Xre family transcriptional regulator